MKNLLFFAGMVFPLLFFSCSTPVETDSSVEVVNEVEGDLSSNLEVVTESTNVEIVQGEIGWQVEFSVELEVVDSLSIEGGYSGGSGFGPIIEYQLLNAEKEPIEIQGYRIQTEPDLDEIANSLADQGSQFEVKVFQTFAWEGETEKVDAMKEKLATAAYVQLTSQIAGRN